MDLVELSLKTVESQEFPEQIVTNFSSRMIMGIFTRNHFIEHVTQALLHALNLQSGTILLGSDGRPGSMELVQRTVCVFAGNLMHTVFVDLRMSMAAASCWMRENHCHLGLFLSGGHHPLNADNGCMGLKVLSPPGVLMRPSVLEKTIRIAQVLEKYQTCGPLDIDFSSTGEKEFLISDRVFTVKVVNSLKVYAKEIKAMFHLPQLKECVQRMDVLIDCSHGVTGPQVGEIMVDNLGIPADNILHQSSLEDYGSLSPDISPENCKDFMHLMKVKACSFGAVINPDGCRCMIVGEDGFLVSPSDSVAVIADQCLAIPLFQENPLKAVYRTICTSKALDKVAKSASLLCFEVLPGWKNYDIAMLPHPGSSILLGEESFGAMASSWNYCSERDGLWVLLAWLSIVAHTRKSIKEILEEHWKKFGRSVFGRLDFKDLPGVSLDAYMMFLKDAYTLRFKKLKSGTLENFEYLDPFGVDPSLATNEAKRNKCEITFDIDNYVHPFGFIRKSLLTKDTHQIYRIHLSQEARLIIRRSESALNSTTLRFYIELCLETNDERLLVNRQKLLEPFTRAAIKLSKIQDFFEDLSPVFV